MSKQMYFQEVQALKKQFIEDSKVLEQRLNSLQKKVQFLCYAKFFFR
ncbi:hypothetical protein [Listeria grayi]|nr:hypothetical protein [Listeria grayi]